MCENAGELGKSLNGVLGSKIIFIFFHPIIIKFNREYLSLNSKEKTYKSLAKCKNYDLATDEVEVKNQNRSFS